MSKVKILNDPVYGFISIPYGIVFDLVEHPYFQRLRRIKQVSLTHYVYPGALHTRFHHALGAYHLTCQAIDVLRSKGTEITNDEAEAVGIAILLHDIGHGPFSHTLEHTLINITHEQLSVMIMEKLNQEFNGKLSLAINIFNNRYHKHFLHQLVSGQLDMDRLDYLNRDSFFTGVSEGVIGYDRIIKMLAVHNNHLVVEEKGIYSIEKFLIARRLMYWQVYLHKTVLSAEQMMIQVLRRAKMLRHRCIKLGVQGSLNYFLENTFTQQDFSKNKSILLDRFATLDDTDIAFAIKSWRDHFDPVLSFLADSLISRRLFKLEFQDQAPNQDDINFIRQKIEKQFPFSKDVANYLLIVGKETNTAYSTSKEEILILLKSGDVKPMSLVSNHGILPKMFTKHYLCYPKAIKKGN